MVLQLVMKSFAKAISVSILFHIVIYMLILRLPALRVPSGHNKTVDIQYDRFIDKFPMKHVEKKTSRSGVAEKRKLSINQGSNQNKLIEIFQARPQITAESLSKKLDKTVNDIFTDTYGDSPNVDNADTAWGVGAGTFERAKDYLLMKKIYEYVDNALFFPSFFHRNNIEGVINARLVINFEGKCDWSKIKFYGEQPYMKLFVLSVLKSACRQNFKPFLKNRLLTNVDLSFHFELTEHTNSQIIEKNKYIVGNSLMFYRNSYKSIMEWEFGPFQGIFPVPAIYLNIPWIQENWEKIMYSKDPISEFKKEFGS